MRRQKGIILDWKKWMKENRIRTRVARFFWEQHTKTGRNMPNGPKIYQIAVKYTKPKKTVQNSHKIYRHFSFYIHKALRNKTKLEFLV
jgi:hypothetical protein